MKRSREDEEEPSAADNDRSSPPVSLNEGSRATKIAELETSAVSSEDFAMRCSLPPHRDAIAFKSYDEYEAHYIKTHTNRCLECGKNLPSEHLLNVHHEECHDSFAAVKRERGEHTYSCFVEGCERKCMTPQKRRMHLIDKHMYPKNFFFAVTKEGIDGRRSLLVEGGHRRRKSSTAVASKESKRKSSILESSSTQDETKMEVDEKKGGKEETQTASPSGQAPQPTQQDPTQRPDTDMEDLAGAMSALQFVPNSVRFGRGGGRAGFAKR